jgi:hypothetical protein
MRKLNLPVFFKPLFWSYNFSQLDADNDKKLIIIQTINYGSLKHWRWIKKFYGREVIRNVLQKVPGSELRSRALYLAGLLFKVEKFNYAPRST